MAILCAQERTDLGTPGLRGRVSAGELTRAGHADLWRQASRGERELSDWWCGGLCRPAQNL